MSDLFVAVATGQNVANLPPILQFAEGTRGDEVLWLESRAAAERKWADGAIEVLRGRGIRSRRAPIAGDINDPAAVSKALKGFLKARRERYRALHIVLNGGQKLTPFGLALAARFWRDELGRPVRFLYGDDRPACVQVRDRRVGNPMQEVCYDPQRMLDLEEILLAQGARLNAPGETLDWKSPPVETRYDTDMDFVRQVHRFAWRKSRVGAEKCPWPGWKDWSRNSRKRFSRAVRERLTRVFGWEMPENGDKRDEFFSGLVSFLRDFLPRTPDVGLSRQEMEEIERDGWTHVGSRFEKATADRTLRFLANRPEIAGIVREVRCNVEVGGDAEWDVVLVLVNGILVVLECKTWRTEKKDLDARIRMLQQASGRLARMYVVFPFYPALAEEPWFPDMHDIYMNLTEKFRMPVIPYTFGNPPPKGQYTIPDRRGGFPWPPSFEEKLERVLSPYVP